MLLCCDIQFYSWFISVEQKQRNLRLVLDRKEEAMFGGIGRLTRILLVPILLHSHYSILVVDRDRRTMQYYNSMRGDPVTDLFVEILVRHMFSILLVLIVTFSLNFLDEPPFWHM